MFYYYLLAVFGALALIGFGATHLFNQPNTRLYDLKKINDSFSDSTSWLKAFGALFSVFYLVANLIIWAAFGVESILRLILFLIHLIRSLLVWIWETILQPTLVFMVKLIWHYPIGFIWKNTQLSFEFIKPSFHRNSIVKSVPKVLRLALITFIGYILHSLIDQGWFTLIVLLGLMGGLVYTLIELALVYSGREWSTNDRNQLLKQFGVLLLVPIVLGGILLFFKTQNNRFSVSEIGFPLTEVLLPIVIIAMITVLLTIPFGVTYYLRKDEKGLGNYVKALLVRLPKLIYALPFFMLGLSIVLIIPFMLYIGLNFGVDSITGKTIDGHFGRVVNFASIDNQYSDLSERITLTEKEIFKIDSLSKADSATTFSKISALEAQKVALNQLGDRLLKKQIFFLEGDFYESENQMFSFPPILNAEEYTWEIKNEDDKVLMSSAVSATEGHSSVIGFKWKNAGKYTISVIPENGCEKGDQYFANVNVLDFPYRSNPINISGPESLCAYDEATFTAKGKFSQYEWVLPEGVSIIEGSGTDKIKVKWGNRSGVVGLRGNNKEETTSKYSVIEVKVTPGLGKEVEENFKYPTDVDDFALPLREEVLYDIAEVKDSLVVLDSKIEEELIARESRVMNWKNQMSQLSARIESFESSQSDLLIAWFSTLFGMLGLSALVLLLIPGIGYFFQFHQRLYAFHEDGDYYFLEQWRKIKARDARQPLFGWFLLIITSLVLMPILGGMKASQITDLFDFSLSSESQFSFPVEEEQIVEYDAQESLLEFRIQIFTGSKTLANKLIFDLEKEGISAELLEKKDGGYRVILSETYIGVEQACQGLIEVRSDIPKLKDAFLLLVEDDDFVAFDTVGCNE